MTDVPPQKPKRRRTRSVSGGGAAAGALKPSAASAADLRALDLEARANAAENRLRAAHSIALTLEASPDLTDAAPALLRTIGECLDWDIGALWLVQDGGVALKCARVWRKADAIGGAFEATTRATVLRRGTGILGRVWEGGLPVWVPDVATDGNFLRAPAAKLENLHSVLAFPLTVGTSILGVIEFFSRAVRPVDEAVVDSARVFGHQIGQFIERRAGEARMRLILKHALDASIQMSASGAIFEWNLRAEQMFGWTSSEAIGQNLSELIIPPSHRPAHARGLMHFLATGEGPILLSQVETTAIRRDGTEFPVELTVTPLHVNGVWSFHGFVRDITVRKRIERNRGGSKG